MHIKIYHIVYMIVWTNLPIKTFVQLSHDQIPIILVLHQFLQSVQFEPTNAFASQYLRYYLEVSSKDRRIK